VVALTVGEIRRLLLALEEPEERWRVRLQWSLFRRRHQAGAQRCHSAQRAARRRLEHDGSLIGVLDSGAVELTDERWSRVAALLTAPARKPGRQPKDHRLMLAGILWVMRTGLRWEDLPAEFGLWSAVYTRYRRWRDSGLWQQLLDTLQADGTPAP
jgi:hypothetical protein